MAAVGPLDHTRGQSLSQEMLGSAATPAEARAPLVWELKEYSRPSPS